MTKKTFSISISSPPLSSSKGNPFLSQNRQFQWTNTGNFIYPIVPAYAASLLSKMGYRVFWDDGVAQQITYDQWLANLTTNKPSLIVIESKTPAIKKHWQIIKELKKLSWKPIVALMGDHVTGLPEESLENSPVDYVITGGDYDFMLENLVLHLDKGVKLEPGFYHRLKNKITSTGRFGLKHHLLDKLPIIDRDLTQWQLYAFNNTNYKYTPGTYLMSGRDCWWGKCTFCSWTTTYPAGTFRNFSVKHTMAEIRNLVENYHIREIFDDSGTLPIGAWLQDLCTQLIDGGYPKKVKIGCNMRFGCLTQKQYDLMGKAGFRFILYGLESSNQETLDRIEKRTQVEDAEKTLRMAKNAGLEPHITIMIGYPWESHQDAVNTLDQAKSFFRQGIVDSMQATVMIPYPGTPLYDYCKKNNLLLTDDWDDYDMRQAVMKSPLNTHDQKILVHSLFKTALEPKFLARKVLSIRSFDDVKYLSTYALKFIKKLRDFS